MYTRVAVVTELDDRRGGNPGYVVTVYDQHANKPGVKLNLTAPGGYGAPKVGTRFVVEIRPENEADVTGNPKDTTPEGLYRAYRRAIPVNAADAVPVAYEELPMSLRRAWEALSKSLSR